VLLLSEDKHYSVHLTEQMHAADMRMHTAPDVNVAKTWLENHFEKGQPLDAVLIDVEMPEGAGWAHAEWLQHHPDYAEAVIMLCRPGETLDAAGARQGVPYCLEKLAPFSELLTVLCKALGLPVPPLAPGRKALARHARSLTVLVAEDNPLNQKLALRILEKMGHRVVFAETGREAFEFWRAGEFDVILMDVDMPEMDGYEATAEIRAYEQGSGRHIPIMAMTAHVMPDVREACLAAGMDGFLAKPINLAELEVFLVGIVGSEVLTGYVDAGRNPALFAEMVEIFIRDYPGYLSEVRNGLSSGDMEKVRRSAHALKGMCMVFAAGAASDAAWGVEHAADIAACSSAAERLERELLALKSSLEERRSSLKS